MSGGESLFDQLACVKWNRGGIFEMKSKKKNIDKTTEINQDLTIILCNKVMAVFSPRACQNG